MRSRKFLHTAACGSYCLVHGFPVLITAAHQQNAHASKRKTTKVRHSGTTGYTKPLFNQAGCVLIERCALISMKIIPFLGMKTLAATSPGLGVELHVKNATFVTEVFSIINYPYPMESTDGAIQKR